jgi:chorismate synthase
MVSVNVLVATVSEGGMAIGAFDVDGPGRERLVGAVYGFATSQPHVLHSHYMAVDPAYRRRGLAVELKQRQRTWCLDHDVTAMRWTYDPLQLANAHLNLQVLGAVGISYHVNHYGTLGGINGSLPSDRVTCCGIFSPPPAGPPVTPPQPWSTPAIRSWWTCRR